MNKRLHKLERIIRYEFNCFITPFYPKDKTLLLLCRISKLLVYKAWYLYDIGSISKDEKDFMIKCIKIYNLYYVNIINNYY